MATPTVTQEAAFEVARVEAEGGPQGAGLAFDQLESRMPTLRGQRMYGVFYPGQSERYFACLRLDDAASDDFGFERAIVPGGLYGRCLIRDWNSRLAELPQAFDALQAELTSAGFLHDRGRPSIEFYRRIDELIIMIPALRVRATK